jgi:hypothetical protein
MRTATPSLVPAAMALQRDSERAKLALLSF